MVVSARPRRPYRWRHNWIPRSPAAALIKAKGNPDLAKRYMVRHGVGGSTSTPKKPRVDEGPYFRKTGPELRDLAGRGDRDAQRELDRREARKRAAGGKVGGKRTGVPFRPGDRDRPTPPARRPEPRPIPDMPHSKRRGGPIGNVPRQDDFDGPRTAREVFGFGSEQHINALNEENDRIEPPGYHLRSRKALIEDAVVTTQYRTDGTRVGKVVERADNPGVFEARDADGKVIGAFTNRRTAHRDLAFADERSEAERKAVGAKKAAAGAKKAAEVTKGLGGPLDWKPHTFESDGTFSGRMVEAKIKQAFRAGNKTVLIEAAMTQQQTREFLADVGRVLEKANLPDDLDVTFHVPSGDPHFRSSRRGTTGAYVIRGTKTVFVNPGIANNRLAASFEAGGHSGHFMPAAKDIPARQYTLTHELGHVVDGQNQHTFTPVGNSPSGFSLGDVPAAPAGEVFRRHSGELSRYGRVNLAESYAEAFAQWVHGGPGSSPVADAYAERFGWPRPRTV